MKISTLYTYATHCYLPCWLLRRQCHFLKESPWELHNQNDIFLDNTSKTLHFWSLKVIQYKNNPACNGRHFLKNRHADIMI